MNVLHYSRPQITSSYYPTCLFPWFFPSSCNFHIHIISQAVQGDSLHTSRVLCAQLSPLGPPALHPDQCFLLIEMTSEDASHKSSLSPHTCPASGPHLRQWYHRLETQEESLSLAFPLFPPGMVGENPLCLSSYFTNDAVLAPCPLTVSFCFRLQRPYRTTWLLFCTFLRLATASPLA